MFEGLTDVGAQNAKFAEHFLYRERISFIGGSLRGERGRRVQFWPTSGRARQFLVEQDEAGVFASERHFKATVPHTGTGVVELF